MTLIGNFDRHSNAFEYAPRRSKPKTESDRLQSRRHLNFRVRQNACDAVAEAGCLYKHLLPQAECSVTLLTTNVYTMDRIGSCFLETPLRRSHDRIPYLPGYIVTRLT
jgi:hypothetical protein